MKQIKYVFAALAATALVANAELITLGDASLESSFSGSNGTPGSGWFSFGGATPAVQVDSGFWTIGNNHGANAAYTVSYNDADGGNIYQTVELDAGKTYRYTVAAAQSANVNKNDAKVQVMFFDAGFSTVLAANNDVVANQSGTFVDYYVDFTPSTTGNYQVGMRNRGYVPGSGADNNESTLFFDNARLEVIPEPATLGLVAIFGGATLFIRRRLKI